MIHTNITAIKRSEKEDSIHLVDDEHRLKNRLPQIGDYMISFLKRMEKHPE